MSAMRNNKDNGIICCCNYCSCCSEFNEKEKLTYMEIMKLSEKSTEIECMSLHACGRVYTSMHVCLYVCMYMCARVIIMK